MGEERFEVERIELTASSFQVEVEIIGVTNIWILNVPYIAIDPNFPHHLNSFDNVPVNYSNGNLVNITTESSTTQTYKNTVNYTQQAAGRTYTRFSSTLSDNKVLLFLTTFFTATFIFPGFVNGEPLDYYVTTTIESEE